MPNEGVHTKEPPLFSLRASLLHLHKGDLQLGTPPSFRMPPAAPPFFSICFLFIKPSVLSGALYKCRLLRSAFQRKFSKTGRYTNFVCCKMKILQWERNPGPSAAPISFRGGCGTTFFLSFFLVSLAWPLELGLGSCNPRFVAWPLELGLGTRNPGFVAWPLELGLGTRNPRFVAWPLELGSGTLNPGFVAWPLELGLGTLNPCFVAWPLELRLGTRNPRFVAWPLELGLGTQSTLCCVAP